MFVCDVSLQVFANIYLQEPSNRYKFVVQVIYIHPDGQTARSLPLGHVQNSLRGATTISAILGNRLLACIVVEIFNLWA